MLYVLIIQFVVNVLLLATLIGERHRSMALVDRIRNIRELHEADEAQEETAKAVTAARIAELEKQVADNTITPESELELEKLEKEFGIDPPAADSTAPVTNAPANDSSPAETTPADTSGGGSSPEAPAA